MISDRLKNYLFLLFCLAIFWFLSTLLFLSDLQHHNEPIPFQNKALDDKGQAVLIAETKPAENYSHLRYSGPSAPDYMQIFSSWKPDIYDLIAYDIRLSNTSELSTKPASISKDDHEQECKQFSFIESLKDKLIKAEGDVMFSFNILISNRIGAFRLLPDTRHALCPKVENDLLASSDVHGIRLKASIIICYYNEAPSALLRTINTLIVRSPAELIEEIIIIDDHSQPGYEVDSIKPFIDPANVRMTYTRTSKREGLIRSRLYGANLAKGDVLIFLDSHIEANLGWLQPLLRIIQDNSTTIACPMIDLINAETMIYTASPMVKGGLNWALSFKWDSVPSNKLLTANDFTKPIDTPAMAGGLYAIKKDYFFHLGAYDSKMELWGGENIEMSLRAWMCGGRVVILPCSRLGHIFRKKRPYGLEPDRPDSWLMNSHRTARVWLDDYIDEYYRNSPQAKALPLEDISERQELRARLKCKSFSWFIENIYPELNKLATQDTQKANVKLTSTNGNDRRELRR